MPRHCHGVSGRRSRLIGITHIRPCVHEGPPMAAAVLVSSNLPATGFFLHLRFEADPRKGTDDEASEIHGKADYWHLAGA